MGETLTSGIRVGDVMTRNYVFISPDTDVRTAARVLHKKKVGSLIVKNKDKLLGLMTEHDVIWAIVKKSEKELSKIKVKDIMKRKVITIKPSADLLEAIHKLKKKRIRRLPVVEYGKVIGMLTLKDILRIEPGLFQMLVESIKIREETSKLQSKKKLEGCGICEVCGEYEVLKEDGQQHICEDCFDKRL